MIELASVQPAKPGSGDRAYSGLHGVWYKDRAPDEGTRPLEVFFAVTCRVVMDADGAIPDPMSVLDSAKDMMQAYIDMHKAGIMVLDPLSIRPDPMDQRRPQEQRPATPPQPLASHPSQNSDARVYVNRGYKIKRLVDEGKVSYVIAFKMANGKESQYPATITNENYLKMLAKALIDAGHEPSKWVSGEPHAIDIEFGVTKSEKTASNGKPFNDYQWFRVVTETANEPF